MGLIKRKADTDLSEQFMSAFGLSDSPIKKSFHKNILKGIKTSPRHKIRLEHTPRPLRQKPEEVSSDIPPQGPSFSHLESDFDVQKVSEEETPIQEINRPVAPPAEPVIQGISEEDHLAALEAAKAAAKEQGYQEGVATGKQQGHNQALSENQAIIETTMAELKASIDDIIAERNNIFSDNEESILKFALHVAEKIIGSEVTQNQKALMSIITDALQKITDSDRVAIKANKEDIPILKAQLPYIETKLPGVKNISIQEDISIKKGGAIIETELGFIDATLSAKLSIIEKALLEQLHGTETVERLS